MKNKVERVSGKMGGVRVKAGLTKGKTEVSQLNALLKLTGKLKAMPLSCNH